MKLLAIAFTVVALSLSSAAAFAQDKNQSKCIDATDVKTADAGFKSVGVRRPKIDQVKTGDVMSVEVQEAMNLARIDEGDKNKIDGVQICGKDTVLYKARVVEDGAFHATEISLPETAKNVSITSCSGATKQCWSGTFDGNFEKWVTLTPGKKVTDSKSVELRGNYKD